MSSRSLRLTTAVALAVPLVAVPATEAQAAKKKSSPPSITSIAPMQLLVGETMTITGKNFAAGKGKNTVVFKRDGGRAVFVKAGKATKTKITVVLPEKLRKYMITKNGDALSTRFRIRVLAKRFGRKFTALSKSPLVGGVKKEQEKKSTIGTDQVVAQAVPVAVPSDCDVDGIPDSVETDDDNDLLSDQLEKSLVLDPCNADTDGDGLEDGFEYQSALDLNGGSLPFPGKRPYPNPLDGTDAGSDYDGDGLAAWQEQILWKCEPKAGQCPGNPAHSIPLSYSAGQKTSAIQNPADNGTPFADTDGRRDADKDQLLDGDEFNGTMIPEYWDGNDKSSPYPETYYATNPVLNDSDGDGINDGADDVDRDGVSNETEAYGRYYDASRFSPYPTFPNPLTDPFASTDPFMPYADRLWYQPFNPCLPYTDSPTCKIVARIGDTWEPAKTYPGRFDKDRFDPPYPGPGGRQPALLLSDKPAS